MSIKLPFTYALEATIHAPPPVEMAFPLYFGYTELPYYM
jgi:hypothetical protein